MSRLIVYAGPNGAGKSTLRDTGEGDAVDVVIDADQIARELAAQTQGDTNWDAGRLAIQRFYQALEQGKSLSLESTLTGQSVLKRMADAKNAEYVVELRYIALESAELHVLRVRGRVARGGHDISPEDIRRRYLEERYRLLPYIYTVAEEASRTGIPMNRLPQRSAGNYLIAVKGLGKIRRVTLNRHGHY